MNVLPELASHSIIGQTPPLATGLLAELRAPRFLPDSASRLLFEPQWTWWILAIAVGIVLWHLGRRAENRKLVQAGMAVAALALLWMLAAYLVVTPAERLREAHQALAQAAKAGDAARIVSYFAPDFQCTALSISLTNEAREEISARLKSVGIKGITITSYHGAISGASGYTRLTVLTETAELGMIKTTWGLSWDDLPGADWRIKLAELKTLQDAPFSPEQVLPKDGL